MAKYDIELARMLCDSSARAYEPNVSQFPGVAKVITDPGTDTLAFIEEHKDYVVVSCRGTRSPRNFILDADFVRITVVISGVEVTVHRGFWRGIEALRKAGLFEALAPYVAAGKAIYFTGHSLGGALAVLAALMVSEHAAGVYTFGQPRVGGWKFAKVSNKLIGDRHWYHEHEMDSVPRLPGILIGYRHSGTMQFIEDEDDEAWKSPIMHTNPKIWWILNHDWGRVSRARAQGLVGEARLLDELLADHASARYQASMQHVVVS